MRKLAVSLISMAHRGSHNQIQRQHRVSQAPGTGDITVEIPDLSLQLLLIWNLFSGINFWVGYVAGCRLQTMVRGPGPKFAVQECKL